MLRKLALSLAIAGVLGVSNANALGLGELNTNSALNEPLLAEIRLIDVGDLSALQIQPRMADADEFSIAGLSRSRFLNNIRFQVEIKPGSEGVIRIISTEPVREPFLNFLLEVAWPNGRLVREYTLLLDPPIFDASPVGGQIQQAVTTSPPLAASEVVAVQPPPQPPLQPPVATAPTAPATQVRVGANDTLWELASRHRPNASITPQQMMVALQRHNPQTFPTANINVIRAGTVMRIPSVEQITSLTATEASAEVARQTEAWRQARAQPAAVSPQADVAEVEAVADESTETQNGEAELAGTDADSVDQSEPADDLAEPLREVELRIVTPEPEVADTELPSPVIGDVRESDPVQLADVADVADGLLQRTDDIENRMLLTLETLDKIERENRDLNDKLDAIQEQLALMQRMLELKEQQIAALQTTSSESDWLDKIASLPVVGGLLAALIAALLALFLSKRRKKSSHPHAFTVPENLTTTGAVAAGSVAAANAVASSDDEVDLEAEAPAIPQSTHVDDDFSDLDLDLDLDLDKDEDEVRVVDDEYDLASENEYSNIFDDAELDDLDESGAKSQADALTEKPNSPKAPEVTDFDSLEGDIEFDMPATEQADLADELAEETLLESTDSLEDLLGADADQDSALSQVEPAQDISDETDETLDDELAFLFDDVEDSDINDEQAETESSSDEDLDNLLDTFELEDAEPTKGEVKKPGEKVEEELTANIVHDLEMDLDDELEGLLNNADEDIELEESQSSEEAIDMLDSLNLLDGADENETKLDLARAYLEMDDAEGAREILGEILEDGNDKQKEEAQKLLDDLS